MFIFWTKLRKTRLIPCVNPEFGLEKVYSHVYARSIQKRNLLFLSPYRWEDR